MTQHKPDKPGNSGKLRGDNPNPRNGDDERHKFSPGFSDRLFCDFGERAYIEIVNGFAQECCLEPKTNRTDAEPPKCGKANAFGTGGNAHGCRCPKDSRHEAHENEWAALFTASHDVIVEILDLEQVADANESKDKKVDDEKLHGPKLEFYRLPYSPTSGTSEPDFMW